MRAVLQAGILPKDCILNPEIPTPGSWGWKNISEKWVLKWMSLSAATEACFQPSNFK